MLRTPIALNLTCTTRKLLTSLAGLLGEHQTINAALAIGMCRAYLKQNLYATGPSASAAEWRSDQHRSRQPIELTQPILDGLRLTKVPLTTIYTQHTHTCLRTHSHLAPINTQ